MRRGYLNLFFLAMATLFMACGGGSEEGNSSVDNTPNGGDEPKNEEVKPAEPTEPNAVCLWPSAISIREEADPKAKYITSVSLGEKIFYMGDDQTVGKHTFSKVKLTDGQEGWARKDFFGIDAKAVAVSSEATIYKRPDLLSKTDKTFDPMDVVAVLSTKDDWLEVKGKRGSWFTEGWIKKSNITEDEMDLVVAVYYTKASMKEGNKKREALQEIVDNSDFASSSFINTINDELSEEPAPEEDEGEMPDSTSVDDGEE